MDILPESTDCGDHLIPRLVVARKGEGVNNLDYSARMQEVGVLGPWRQSAHVVEDDVGRGAAIAVPRRLRFPPERREGEMIEA